MKQDRMLKTVASPPKDPHARFLIEGFTYGELYGLAASLASKFKTSGRSTPVCVCTQNRALVAAGLIAALYSDRPLVFPYDHSARVLGELRQNLSYHHALSTGEIVLPSGITAIDPTKNTQSDAAHRQSLLSNLDATWAYLFTGGSTGTPRIWSKTVRNLLWEATWLARKFSIGATDRILATVPANHIYGLLYSVILPLVSGASVSSRTVVYPAEIVQAMKATGATILVSIPAHYRALGNTAIHGNQLTRAFASAGALDPEDGLMFRNSTRIAVTEIYGSTETGGIAHRHPDSAKSAFIPFDCLDIKIENRHLWVRSEFLSKELPCSDDGYYKTADRAVLSAKEGFQLLGRSDGIVKVAGKRVDLAQVQQVIAAAPEVRDAYVFSRPARHSRENEILAVVAGQATAGQIMRIAKGSLPSYAIPRSIKIVPEIPHSAVGKYDHTAIKKLFGEALR